LVLLSLGASEPYSYRLALLQYKGGGDWYANPTALPNLAGFLNANLGAAIDPNYATVEVGSPQLFNYPFAHLTGHGNVVWSDAEVRNLQNYLEAGGFIHIDDNYGMDPYIRRELAKLFPGENLQAIGADHPIYQQVYAFPEGLPKIHRHDNKAPEAWGYYVDGRLALLYTYESDLSDGWEDPAVHNDPPEVRQKALQMGANILMFALNNP